MAGVWTKNWANVRRAWAADRSFTDAPIYNLLGSSMTGGALLSFSRPMSPLNNGPTTSTSYCFVRFGSSDTTPDEDDWNLDNAFASGLTYVETTNSSKTYDPATGLVTMTSTVAVLNSESAPKTIREWGLIGNCNGNVTSGNSNLLFYRAVLDEPITLQHNWTLELTITRTMQLEVLE